MPETATAANERPSLVTIVLTIVLNFLAIFAVGLSLTGWLAPVPGVVLMAIAVIYLGWELFTANWLKKRIEPMLRLLFAVFVLCVVASISVPRVVSKLREKQPDRIDQIAKEVEAIKGGIEAIPRPGATASVTVTKGHIDIHPELHVHLIFKASPLFTDARKKQISRTVDDFWRYLASIGFDPPKEFPPLEVEPGRRAFAMERQFPGTIYSDTIRIGEKNLDNSEDIRAMYARYIFDKLFNTGATDRRGGFQMASAEIFARYYLASASNKPPVAANKWDKALWDIRLKHGKEFTDRALFYTFKQWEVPVDDPEKEDFDAFFGGRFWNGVHVEDNRMQHRASIASILETEGVGSR